MFPVDSFVFPFFITERSVGRVVKAIEEDRLIASGLVGRFLHDVGCFRAREDLDLSAVVS